MGGMRAAKLALSLARGDTMPEAIGADQSEAGRSRRFLAGIGKRAGSVPKAGSDDDRGRRTFFAGHFHNAGDRARRRRDHQQIGWRRQILNGLDRGDAFDLAIARVDQRD